MNALGVALAADSAVTFAAPVRKIYSSADKLFQLASNAPVGVMVYGSAAFAGLPWETIIKEFRRQLGSKTFPQLRQYASALMSFIGRRNLLLTKQDQHSTVEAIAIGVFVAVRDAIAKRLDESKKNGSQISDALVVETCAGVLTDVSAHVAKAPDLPSLPKGLRAVARREYGSLCLKALGAVLGTLPMHPDTRSGLVSLAIEVLFKTKFGSLLSGVVIAGFGESEARPSMLSYEVEGIVLGRPRHRTLHDLTVGKQVHACIVPFAQKEMVHLFMNGIDESLDGMVRKSTAETIKRVTEALIDEVHRLDPAVAARLSASVLSESGKVSKELLDRWSAHQRSQHSDPVMTVVLALPKDELGAMAEMLVNLTRSKRRVSTQEETVGGPIDVAVITKGDGFVWLRRKHYFDPSLNPRIMRRYQLEGA